MRIILFYDVPMTSAENVQEYNRFHKSIIKRGFVMIQNSVYFKVIVAGIKYNQELNHLNKILPTNGNVRTILISDNQYDEMKLLRGDRLINEEINSTKRYLKI